MKIYILDQNNETVIAELSRLVFMQKIFTNVVLENFEKQAFKRFVYEYFHFGRQLAKAVLKKNIEKLGYQRAYTKMFSPVTDWSRFAEFFCTSEILIENVKDGDSILDIGSPKLFPIWLSTKKNLQIRCTDIFDYAVSEYSYFWDFLKTKQKSILIFETADLLDLRYNDNEFDAIFSISTIEHALDDNWKSTISKNLSRVLKNGKIVIITTPFGSKSVVQYKKKIGWSNKYLDSTNRNFFMRVINEEDLNEFIKIAEKYDLHLEKLFTINYSANVFSKLIRRLPVHLFVLFGFLYPRFAVQNYGIKIGAHPAECEKYDKMWKSDIITSDIVIVFRKKISSHKN